MHFINIFRFPCFVLCLLLSGCVLFNSPEPAPVVSLTDYHEVTSGIHVVSKGETLYQIAFKYGRDYRDIAAVNHLSSPYTIYPNQKLNLRLASTQERRQELKPATVQRPIKELKPTPQFAKNEQWQWPVRGNIIKSYSAKGGFKGIDIGGKLRAPVLAAKSGKVVYSGNGLRGYGNLLIIKHDESYLSAYGHNDKLLVKEGDWVTKGQQVALMGKTDTQSVRLHFEIRKDGKPINPISVL